MGSSVNGGLWPYWGKLQKLITWCRTLVLTELLPHHGDWKSLCPGSKVFPDLAFPIVQSWKNGILWCLKINGNFFFFAVNSNWKWIFDINCDYLIYFSYIDRKWMLVYMVLLKPVRNKFLWQTHSRRFLVSSSWPSQDCKKGLQKTNTITLKVKITTFLTWL